MIRQVSKIVRSWSVVGRVFLRTSPPRTRKEGSWMTIIVTASKNYRKAAEVCVVQPVRAPEKNSHHYTRMRVRQFSNGMSD